MRILALAIDGEVVAEGKICVDETRSYSHNSGPLVTNQ